MSWVPLQIVDPDRVGSGPNDVYLFAAGNRKAFEVRERWSGAVAENRPFEKTSFGEFHAYFARSRDELEALAQEFRELARLCGGTPVPPVLPPKPIVESIAGIRIGAEASLAQAVLKGLGSGLSLLGGGRSEGRYFTDPGRSITLHIRSTPSPWITCVELAEGVVLPEELIPSSPALLSPSLSSRPPIDQGLALGMSYGQVVRRLGRPKTDIQTIKERTLIYEATPQDNPRVRSFYVAILKFAKDRLVSLSIKDV